MPKSRVRKKGKPPALSRALYRKVTFHLTASLLKMLQQVDITSKQHQDIIGSIQYYMEKWRELEKQSGSTFAMKYFYKILDSVERKIPITDRLNIKCKKGCSFCCHIQVNAVEPEVDVILNYVKEHNIPIDMEHLEKQTHIKDDIEWMLHPNNKCVFLSEQGECNIYPVRPLVCRKYFVDTDPMWCDGMNNPENLEVVGVQAFTEMECATTATINVGYTFDTLGKLLYKKLSNVPELDAPLRAPGDDDTGLVTD